MEDKFFTCKICKKYLKLPVKLPCDNSICREHVVSEISRTISANTTSEYNEDYKELYCYLCKKNHNIALIDGYYQINRPLQKRLESFMQSNSERHSARILINEMKVITNRYGYSSQELQDQLTQNEKTIREQIETQKKIVIDKLNETAKKIFERLEQYHMKIIENSNIYESERIVNSEMITKLEDELRSPELCTHRLEMIIAELKNSISLNNHKIEMLNNLIEDSRKVKFLPSVLTHRANENLIGNLNLKNSIQSLIKNEATIRQSKRKASTSSTSSLEAQFQSQKQYKFEQEVLDSIEDHHQKMIQFKRFTKIDLHQLPVSCVKHITQNLYASGSQDGCIKLWSLDDLSDACTPLKTLTSHTDTVECLEIGKNFKLISGSYDRTIKIWNLFKNKKIDGTLLATLIGHTDDIWSLLISRTNSNILASSSSDFTIKFWSLTDFKCLNTLKAHANKVYKILESPLDDSLISCSEDSNIKIWTLNDVNNKCEFTLKRVLRGHTKSVYCMDLHSNGNLISGSIDCTIRVWNLNGNGECLRIFDVKSKMLCLKYMGNDLLFIGNETQNNDDKNIKILKLDHDQYLKKVRVKNCKYDLELNQNCHFVEFVSYDDFEKKKCLFTCSSTEDSINVFRL